MIRRTTRPYHGAIRRLLGLRRRAPILFAGVSLLLLSFGHPASARSAPDELRLSLDGRTWRPQLDVVLFDLPRVWVPGDTATVSIWAQNASEDPARLSIGLIGSDAPNLLDVEGASLHVSTGDRARTVTTSKETRLVSEDPLDGGEDTRVDITFTLADSVGNEAQDQQADIGLLVTLTQHGDEPGDTPGGRLPTTGEGRLGWLTLAGAGAIVAGWSIRRRKTHGENHA